MKTTLESRNLTVKTFMQQYPLLYQWIIVKYGGRALVYDPHAAICLYLNNQPVPVCELCNIPLAITPKFRMQGTEPHRCKAHINSNSIISLAELESNNVHQYQIINMPDHASKSSYRYSKFNSLFDFSLLTHLNGSESVVKFGATKPSCKHTLV